MDEKMYIKEQYYVFCVNFTGLVLANYLARYGKKVVYLDNDEKKWNQIVVGHRCIPPSEGDVEIACIIAANNPESQMNIKHQLLDLGYENIEIVDSEWKKRWVDAFAPEMDDELYLRTFWYWRKGYNIDLNSPKTYNEKLQWLKLHDRNPKYKNLVDKYEVKKWVKNVIGQKYVIPNIKVYSSSTEIDEKELPSRFVLKCTHDSGGIRICKDKNSFDLEEAKVFLQNRMHDDYFYPEREWTYKGIVPRILAEELLVDTDGKDILDYKFFCFNGEPQIIQVDIDRFGNHRRNLFTTEWDYLEASIGYPSDSYYTIARPDALDEMLYCARELSKEIPHVRVDLYYVSSKVYFGEMTFYHGGGYEVFKPTNFAYTMGDYITIV